MKTLIDNILQSNRIKNPNKTINIYSSIVASIFSVIFSLSLIKEAYRFISEWYILALLTVFIVTFLIFNEYHKVLELRKRFQYNGKHGSFFIIVFTFVISFCMSGVGIYLWTNKTLQETSKNESKNTHIVNDITLDYNHRIDSVLNIKIENTPEYNRLNTDLNFWKGRSAASLEEREKIREEIKRIQEDISLYRSNFNQDIQQKTEILRRSMESELSLSNVDYSINKRFISRASYISFIFFLMVIFTEIIIIFLARQRGEIDSNLLSLSEDEIFKQFQKEYNIITDILSRRKTIEINDFKYSIFMSWENFDKDVKNPFGRLIELGIASKEISLNEAQRLLKNYYNNILQIKQ